MKRTWTGNTRANWHDYTSRCIYHITLMKNPGVPDFGTLAGDCNLQPGTPSSPYIRLSPIGQAIKHTLLQIRDIHPALQLYQYAIMPDHLHLLLNVQTPLDDIIGHKIAALKVHINKRANTPQIFAKGFNDQIIDNRRDLDTLFNYIRHNPYRLAIRLAHPYYFRRVSDIQINQHHYAAYGNLHLLENPFKHQVVIHRADSQARRQHNRNIWTHCAANGGVLVSPFISPAEKEIRAEAEQLGGKIILISDRSYGERSKPDAHDFSLCEQGRLLILTPTDPDFPRPFSRATCLAMNARAATLCSTPS